MNPPVTLAGYALHVLALVLVELIARRTGRLPTSGRTLSAVLARPGWRLLLLAGWLWVGLHFFVRSSAGT